MLETNLASTDAFIILRSHQFENISNLNFIIYCYNQIPIRSIGLTGCISRLLMNTFICM